MQTSRRSKQEVIEEVSSLVEAFLRNRLRKLQGTISEFLNVNPFLLSALQHLHSFNEVSDVAEFLFISHMSQGHSTGFGKLMDEKIVPQVFGTTKLTATARTERKWTAAAFDEIDHIVPSKDGGSYSLLSLKSGPWTIQHSTAMSLYHAFKQLSDFALYGEEIVVGVMYGNSEALTNKYRILRGINPRQQEQFVELRNVRVLAGQEFWAWLNGGELETQFWILDGTRVAADKVARDTDSALVRDAPTILAKEFRKKYGLSSGENLNWRQLLVAINSLGDE